MKVLKKNFNWFLLQNGTEIKQWKFNQFQITDSYNKKNMKVTLNCNLHLTYLCPWSDWKLFCIICASILFKETKLISWVIKKKKQKQKRTKIKRVRENQLVSFKMKIYWIQLLKMVKISRIGKEYGILHLKRDHLVRA